MGTARVTTYKLHDVEVEVNARRPAVLRLADLYYPDWKVTVDGKPEKLLRANFIMRAVALSPGEHQIVFHFAPSTSSRFVSLAAIVLGFALIGVLVATKDRASGPTKIRE